MAIFYEPTFWAIVIVLGCIWIALSVIVLRDGER
jgi:hypothetical protein